jgi:Tol biopolymer transport system component
MPLRTFFAALVVGACLLAGAPPPTALGDEQKDDKEKKKWDVNAPPGEAATVPIDTRTGTWMSVDLSPDGKTLLFDMLGDLYTLPIEGGEAKPLTHSIAWEMQGRFSPDGKTIAYMSDGGGGDNIWLMNADGTNPRALTSESFRLVNNPVWHPRGDAVAVRKHFTGTRSLGTGEIWLYHTGGGKGVALNDKPNWQKDLGEPAFSPDARYVYFSQDTTPGRIFQYNKNSNQQIYVIQRLDLTDGTIEPFVTGPGGAVRPVPSPDGKQLAFVRRVRGQSTLFVKDLRTGIERPVWNGLERDLQEAWAIHGVYPSFDWTPDAREIVAWAQGKLWRSGA